MHYYMREALSQLKKDPNAKHLVKLASKEQDLQHLSIKPSLQEQWKLTKTERTIRANQEGERVFSMNENTWDSPKVTDTGMISFFRVVKKSQENIPVAADVRKAQNLLSMDARRCLASSMIERIKDSEAIHLVNMKSHAK